MSRAKRALVAIDTIIHALRRRYMNFSDVDCELLAEDLAYARDLCASVTARQKVRNISAEVKEVMLEDIRRK